MAFWPMLHAVNAITSAAAAQLKQLGLPALHDVTVTAEASKARVAHNSFYFMAAVERVEDAIRSTKALLGTLSEDFGPHK